MEKRYSDAGIIELTGKQLDPSKQQELLVKIGRKMVEEAPNDWTEIVYTRASIADQSFTTYTVKNQNGDTLESREPVAVNPLFEDLRAGLYRDGKGTWFSVHYSVTHPGRFSIKYNYEDPEIPGLIGPAFTNDLKYFPRDEEHIPAWLQQKLDGEADG
ncbi:antitoxin YezG family protein [Nocardiopsis sp. JB363]|uniref:antitoxin YezG family protein n=1 Tax=Nocardiopsis sp. JB363 TaxID=1434837 RepID=UPI001F1F3770|nr:antitoxin YezG family protein [Nocardiopsis sp. JB363]